MGLIVRWILTLASPWKPVYNEFAEEQKRSLQEGNQQAAVMMRHKSRLMTRTLSNLNCSNSESLKRSQSAWTVFPSWWSQCLDTCYYRHVFEMWDISWEINWLLRPIRTPQRPCPLVCGWRRWSSTWLTPDSSSMTWRWVEWSAATSATSVGFCFETASQTNSTCSNFAAALVYFLPLNSFERLTALLFLCCGRL